MSVSQIGIAQIPENQRMLGKGILVLTTAVLISTFVFQFLHKTETISAGFENWQPVMYAYLVWAICLCWSQVLIRGERGKRALFVLRDLGNSYLRHRHQGSETLGKQRLVTYKK